MFPKELIEEIRVQNDIIDIIDGYVPLKQKGSSYFGLCPFHNEKSPSFSVDSQKQFYHCFGCGEAGNVYSFIMKMENCNFVEAVERLAERVHIALPSKEMAPDQVQAAKLKERLLALHKACGRFYYDALHTEEGAVALDYLQKREISPKIQKKFGLGFAPSNRHMLYRHLEEQGFTRTEMLQSGLVMESKDTSKGLYDRFYNRLMFPIMDAQGQVIGFGGRILGKGEPKYLNSPETVLFNKSRNLFGLNFARASRKKEILLVEGYMDMISLYQAGFTNTAASLGTAFNQEHARTLKKYANSVILIYDSDDAGRNAALRAIPVLVQNGFAVRVLQVPSQKDPDGFVREHGAIEFSKLLYNAVHYIVFQIACSKENFNLDNPEHKVRFTKEAAQILAKLENDIERSVYIKEIGSITGIVPDAIDSEVNKLRQKEEQRFLKEANEKRKEQYSTQNKSKITHKGIREAQKNILNLCASKISVYEQIKTVLQLNDFTEIVYQKLFLFLGEIYDAGGTVIPAGLISQFETSEEQKMATEVFACKPPFATMQDLEKGFNDQWKLLKRANIDKLAQSASTVNEVQQLLETKRKLETLYITIVDG